MKTTAPQADQFQRAPRKPVQFGGWYGYPDYSQPLPVDACCFTGFTPDATIQELFNTSQNPVAFVIDSPKRLNHLWEQLNMPQRDKPSVSWNREAIVIVAQQRTNGTSAKPQSLHYDSRNNRLIVRLEKETKKGRMPGTAWYIGKVPNGANHYRGRDHANLSSRTRVQIREVEPDNS